MVEWLAQATPNGSMNIVIPAGFVALLFGQLATAWWSRPRNGNGAAEHIRESREAMGRIKALMEHARREESAMGDAFKDFRAVADRITTEIVKLRTETHDLRGDIRELLIYLKKTNGRS